MSTTEISIAEATAPAAPAVGLIDERIALRCADLMALAVRYSARHAEGRSIFVDWSPQVSRIDVRMFPMGWHKLDDRSGEAKPVDLVGYLNESLSLEWIEDAYQSACQFFGVDPVPSP